MECHLQIRKFHIILIDHVSDLLKSLITAFRNLLVINASPVAISVIFFIIYFPSTTEFVSPSIPAAIINTINAC